MRTSLLILLMFISFGLHAQKWAPLGSSYTYTLMDQTDMYFKSKPVKWTVVDTVTKKGHLCSILQSELSTTPNPLYNKMISYADADKVYWYIPELDDFTVLYDFSKSREKHGLLKA